MALPVWTSRPSQLAALLLTTTALTGINTDNVHSQGLPTGYSTAYGSVGFQKSSGTLTINQSSQNAIVNYNSFSIGQSNTVNINQPNSRSVILNRVTGNTPSTIAGQLNANGQVYLINPNGIAITKTGVVKVGGGFVASTLGMSDDEFKHGRKHFKGNGASAAVTNAGTITIGRGGYAALIGGEVKNSGKIAVPMGKVGLGSGEMATLDVSGDGFLQVALPTTGGAKGALVSNSGLISAAGGTVVLDAATARAAARSAVNISGTIDAHSISGHNGSITIGGGDGGRVNVSGTLNVSGGTRYAGGTVAVTGRKIKVSGTIDASGRHGGTVTLAAANGTKITGTVKAVGHEGNGGAITVSGLKIAFSGAKLDASGATGGGTIKVGGDLHGGGALAHAGTVTIDAASIIKADATGTGNGGSVVVWSDLATSFAGTISAKGGAQGGDAGSTEVSSHGLLSYTGTTDLTAPKGAMGTLLLDPYNITISDAADSGTPLVSGVGLAAQTSNINITTLEAALNTANVSLSTGAAGSVGTDAGNIALSSASGATLTWTSSATLSLTAANAITLGAPISAAAGGLTLNAGGAISAPSAISLARFTLQSGAFSQITPTLPAFSAGDFELAGGTFVRATGGIGTAATPYTLTDIYGVQGVGTMLTQNYQLAANIDASQTATWYAGAGFAPIGSNDSIQFNGTFDGAGHMISNLTVNRAGDHSNYAGLFGDVGSSGVIENVGLLGGMIRGYEFVGGLVGRNHGTVTHSYATGAVNASIDIAGGLVGENEAGAHISQAYATGAVGAQESVGGLVGINQGTISQAYATGAASAFDVAGGFVGDNRGGGITQSYATGAVSVSSNVPQLGGGFAGVNQGVITSSFYDSYTTGKSQAVGTQTSGSAAVTAVTSNPMQTETAYQQSAYAGLTFVTSPAGAATAPGFYLVDGATRPFLSSEYSTTITNSHQLELINLAPTASYTLANNIDLGPDLAAVNGKYPGLFSAAGFAPIGGDSAGNATNNGNGFTGTFNGAGHTIANLTVNQPSTNIFVGLFAYVGTAGVVENVGLIGGTVNGGDDTGGLVGENDGTITQAYSTVDVSGTRGSVGGLVGANLGSITQAYATGVVSGGSNQSSVGGLVGLNGGSIIQSYATGPVSSGAAAYVGGLVGSNDESISQSYATGAVSVGSGGFAGGLAGGSFGSTITQAYATGSVTGGADAFLGGLIGYLYGGAISQTYATGAVSATTNSGGLVGITAGDGDFSKSYYDSFTTGQTTAGVSGNNIGAVTSDTAQSGASNYAYTQSAYTGFTFVTSPAGAATTPGFYMVNGATRPFLSSEYSTTITNSHQIELINLAPGASYTLANNIDLGPDLAAVAGKYPGLFSAAGFAPIGVDASGNPTNGGNGFTGTFDGAGYTISNLLINRTGTEHVGLFGVTTGATISNLSLINASVTGFRRIGLLVGLLEGDSSVSFVSVSGSATSIGVNGSGATVGGLIGDQENSAVYASSANVIVTGSQGAGGTNGAVGGLVGGSVGGTIKQSFATGNVTGAENVGGLDGFNDSTAISNTYATGSVQGGNFYTGGLVGQNYAVGSSITASYAVGAVQGINAVGGLIGQNTAGSISNSYFDVNTTGQAASTGHGATGYTTAQLQNLTSYATTYAGFDFQNVWSPPNQVGQNNGSTTAYYPQLYALQHITTVGPTGSRMYAAANSTAPSRYYGVQAGDYVTTLATVTSAATGTSNAGTSYAATAAGALTTTDGSVTTASGAAYRYVYLPAGTLTVTPAVIAVTGLNGVDKTYDGTATIAAGTMPYTVLNPISGVTVSDTSAAYAGGRTASATAESINVAGLATNNPNYATSTTMVTSSGTISPEAITVTAATNTKTYDGNTSAAATPTLTSGTIYSPDTATYSETYDNANAGTGKTLAPLAKISDGNNGGNYIVTYVTNTTGVINPMAVTAVMLSGTMVYNGTTNAPASELTVTNAVNGDTVGLTGTGVLASKNVGAEMLTSTNGALTGLMVSNPNYTVTGGSGSVTVTPAMITVTAASKTKTYDGNTSAAATPTLTSGTLYDTASFSETYASANAGTGKTLTPTGTISDGNGGNNYTVTYQTSMNGVINARPVTLMGAKTYDGTTSVPASQITVANTVPGDNVGLSGTGALASKNAGTEALTSTNGALTGLSVTNANYTVTGGSGSVLVLPAAITVTAAANTKTYDGTISAAATPTVTSGLLYDLASFSETYASRNAGTGLTLTPTGTISDGNGGNNYTVTYQTSMNGAINARPVTLSGTQTYDGTTNAPAANLTVTDLVAGDNATLSGTGTMTSRNAGINTLTSTNGALTGLTVGNTNYTLTGGSGSVSVARETIMVTAAANTKTYDGNTSAAAMPTVTGTIHSTDTASFSETYDNANAGTGKTLTPTGTISDGNGGNNYTVTYVTNTTGVINPMAVTAVMLSGTMVYNGTTNAPASELTVTNAVNGDTVGLTGTGVLASKNVGAEMLTSTNGALTGLMVSNPNYTVTGGSGSVTVTPAPLSVTGLSGTTIVYANTVVDPLSGTAMLSGTTYSGDNVSVSGTAAGAFANSNVGTGKAVAVSGLSLTGSGAGNYTLTLPTTLTANITPAPLTVSGAKTYDATTAFATNQLAVAGGVNGETVMLTSGLGTSASADAGSYSGSTLSNLTIQVIGGNAMASNYALPVTGTLVIGKATVTVAGATSVNKTYDATTALPGGTTGFTYSGAVNNNVTVTATSAMYGSSNAGPEAVNVAGLTISGTAANDYVLSSTSVIGSGTISPATVTVTALGGSSIYGTSPANSGLSATGLQGGQNVAVLTGLSNSFAITGQTHVGSYTTTVQGMLTNANYVVGSTTNGSFTVTPRSLSIAADDQSRDYGGVNPPLTYTVGATNATTGLVNGDGLAGVLATTATTSSTGGAYPITQGTLAATTDYALAFTPGTLTVGQQPMVTPPATPAPVVVDLSATLLASTVDRAYLQAQGDPAFGLPLLSTLPGDGTLASQIVSGLGDPRFDVIIVCVRDFCTIAPPREQKKISQLEVTPR